MPKAFLFLPAVLGMGVLLLITTLAGQEEPAAPVTTPKAVPKSPVAAATVTPPPPKAVAAAPASDVPPLPFGTKAGGGQPGLSLSEALGIAYKKSPLILEAADAIRQASGFTVQTRSLALPRLVLTSDTGHADKYQTANLSGDNQSPQVPTTQARNQAAGTEWSVQLKLVKTVFDAGMTRDLIGSAKVSEAMASYSMEDVIQQTDLQVRLAFYQVLCQQERLIAYRNAISLLQGVSQRIQNQRQFGGANDFNVLRSVVGEDFWQPLFQEAMAEYETAEEQLAALLGVDYDEAQRILFGPGVAGTLAMKVDSPSLINAVRRAENDRPLVKKLEMAAEAERLGMAAEAASYYPRISLFGAVGESGLPTTRGTQERTNNAGYIVGLSGVWSVFDGGLAQGKEAQAKAVYDSAVSALIAAKESSELQVREQARTLEAYQRQVDSYAAVSDRLKRLEDLASDRAFNSTGTIFELTQTLQMTIATRLQLQQEIYALNAARAQLDYLTGTDVRVSQDQ